MALLLLHCDNLLCVPLLKEVFTSLTFVCARCMNIFSFFRNHYLNYIRAHTYMSIARLYTEPTITNVSHVRHRHHKVKKLKIQFANFTSTLITICRLRCYARLVLVQWTERWCENNIYKWPYQSVKGIFKEFGLWQILCSSPDMVSHVKFRKSQCFFIKMFNILLSILP